MSIKAPCGCSMPVSASVQGVPSGMVEEWIRKGRIPVATTDQQSAEFCLVGTTSATGP